MRDPQRVGDRVLLDGDAFNDERADQLVEDGFGFHDLGEVVAYVSPSLSPQGPEVTVRVRPGVSGLIYGREGVRWGVAAA